MTKTLIVTPCTETAPIEFMTAFFNLKKPEGTSYSMVVNSLVYTTRNDLSVKAIYDENNPEVNRYDRVLWLDSDMVFEPDALIKLSEDMDQGLDFVSGLYFKRRFPTGPVIYKKTIYEPMEGGVHSEAIPYDDYPRDSLFDIEGAGFGIVMTSTKLLRDVWNHFGPPFDPMTQVGEDLSFCWRVKQLGYRMWCDSRVKAGHVGQFIYDEAAYLKQKEGR